MQIEECAAIKQGLTNTLWFGKLNFLYSVAALLGHFLQQNDFYPQLADNEADSYPAAGLNEKVQPHTPYSCWEDNMILTSQPIRGNILLLQKLDGLQIFMDLKVSFQNDNTAQSQKRSNP